MSPLSTNRWSKGASSSWRSYWIVPRNPDYSTRGITMKKMGLMLLVTTLVFGVVVGCSSQSALEQEEKKQDDNIKIGLSVSTLNNPFFVSLKEGAEQAAKKAGTELIVADAQDDNAKQLNDVEDQIQKNVDILLINPSD